jgi:hypothetical protein
LILIFKMSLFSDIAGKNCDFELWPLNKVLSTMNIAFFYWCFCIK